MKSCLIQWCPQSISSCGAYWLTLASEEQLCPKLLPCVDNCSCIKLQLLLHVYDFICLYSHYLSCTCMDLRLATLDPVSYILDTVQILYMYTSSLVDIA